MKKDSTSKKNSAIGKKILIVLVIAFLVLAVVAAVICFGLNNIFNMIPRNFDASPTMSVEEIEQYIEENTESIPEDYTGEVLTDKDVHWDTVDVDPLTQGNHIINFLLIGKDRESSGYSRTDTMILCTINKSKKTITLTSFMRDLYLKLPNGYSNRINASYVFGGVDLLSQTIEETFGITIHGTFEVDFQGFKDVIDFVDGVEITLSGAEAAYMNKYVEGATRSFTEGTYVLNGNEALTYARMRQVGAGDFTRTERQRLIIEKIYYKCYQMSPTELYKLMEKVLPMITTNLTNGQIMSYAAQLLPVLSDLEFDSSSRIPADGTYKMVMINKMSVLLADINENRKVLEKIMEP